jgi:preprotein translocase subunit SecE
MAQETKELKNANKKKDSGKFFKDIILELKKVNWPNRSQLSRNTITVIISCFIVGVIIWLLDFGFERMYNLLFNK